MTSIITLSIVATILSCTLVAAQPAAMGFPCPGKKGCEVGAKCLPLNGVMTCLPETDFSRDGRARLFGECNKFVKCGGEVGLNRVCLNGICVIKTPRTCKVTNIAWMNYCSEHTTCQNGKCLFGLPGDTCQTTWSKQRCLPGLRCVGNPPNGPANSKGTCQRVKEGSRCVFNAECPIGTQCTSRWRCEKTVTGAPCYSNFWCPPDHECVKPKNSAKGSCQLGSTLKGGFTKVSPAGRGRSCNTEIDCPLDIENRSLDARCINKICMPPTLGQQCKTNEQCGVATTCQNGSCVEAVLGSKCRRDVGSCYSGMWCEYWASNRCTVKGVGRTCKTFRQCPPGMGCKGGKCAVGAPGDYCVEHAQCAPGTYCIGRTCQTPSGAFARKFLSN